MSHLRHHISAWKALASSLFFASMVLLLSACGEAPSAQQPVISAPQETPTFHTVRFMLEDTVLNEQRIAEGRRPDRFQPELEGLYLRAWGCGEEEYTRPELEIIRGDTDYIALVSPRLTEHLPYLFPNERGFLRPDAVLQGEEMEAAFRALTPEAFRDILPAVPEDMGYVTVGELREALLQFFEADAVESALPPRRDYVYVTRAAFSTCMNQLLERDQSEVLTVRRGGSRAPDVSPLRSDYTDLLEASISHLPDALGDTWADYAPPSPFAPGLLLLDGQLYNVDETGTAQVNCTLGYLYFGSDGVYTSGNPTLDSYVREVICQLVEENPEAEGLDLLRLAFDYTRDSFQYLRKPPYQLGDVGRENHDAVVMFSTKRGNCYNYAAVFRALARGLGWQARAVSGKVGGAQGGLWPHGWVEIVIDGQNYLFDAELDMAARRDGNPTTNRFMLPYSRYASAYYRGPNTFGYGGPNYKGELLGN